MGETADKTVPERTPTAHLEATFSHRSGKTWMSACRCLAPLKIAKTFALEKGVGVCVMDSSPGLLAGDFYRYDWHLEANSRVAISTQGFTRVHPSREAPCRLNQQIRLEKGAVLEWFPEPLMLYRDAALRSETGVEIGENATLLWGEIGSAGRVGRGEAFEFHAYQSRLRVRRAGRLIFAAQNALRPSQFAPKRVGAWENYTHQGQFLVFSDAASAYLLAEIRAILEDHPTVWGGASQLETGGIVVSMLGHRAHDLQSVTASLRAAALRFLGF